MSKVGHLDYLVPHNNELDIPYRASKKLKDAIHYIYSHPTVPKRQRKLFLEVSQSGSRELVNDMAVRAIAMTKHFLDNPQQYGHSMNNIHFQILRRMWKQIFSHMWKQSIHPEQQETEWKYLGITFKMLSIENNLLEELIRVVKEKDYIQHSDDMVKKRTGVGLRQRRGLGTHEGSKNFEYLCGLE